MSPKAGGRAQRQQRRNLLISVLVVVAISLGSFAAVFAARWSPRLGLDLAGGVAVVYTAEGSHITQSDLDETVNILNLRVNGLGVSGAEVQTTGKNQISVSIPGRQGRPAGAGPDRPDGPHVLPPRAVLRLPRSSTKAQATPGPAAARHRDDPGVLDVHAAHRAESEVTPNNSPQGYSQNNVPPDPQFATYPSTSPQKPDYAKSTVLLPGLQNACGLAGAPVRARPVPDDGALDLECHGDPEPDRPVGRRLHARGFDAGSALWDKVAQENFHQLLGIELDGDVYSAPIIQPTQTGCTSFAGRGEISGNLTQADAQNLAQAMNYGALPITLKAATSETVSATLGHSALVAGLAAGVGGLILVLLYVLAYYRALGLVVISGLVLTAMMLWAIISALGHTTVAPSFDLAGITGLIVSIGITVDSYIVYFERLKDETRSGRSVRTSVDRGFKSAWRTVWAADFVSLLAAIVLYFVAVGNVKGFAFFLGLSTIMDMAVTWFYTRPLVILLGSERAAPGLGCVQHLDRPRRGTPGNGPGRRRRHGRCRSGGRVVSDRSGNGKHDDDDSAPSTR